MKHFDFVIVFVFGLALSNGAAVEDNNAFKERSCDGNDNSTSNGCSYGSVAGNCVLTVTNCTSEFNFESVSGNGDVIVPKGVPLVVATGLSGNGEIILQSAATEYIIGNVTGGKVVEPSCSLDGKCDSDGCHYGSVSGNSVLTVTNCNSEFSFSTVSGNGKVIVPKNVTSVKGYEVTGNGCIQTEDSATKITIDKTSSNGKVVEGGSCKAKFWCIASDNLLWSCTKDGPVRAGDVSIGDSVRVAAKNVGEDGTTCSDVYYVYRHEEMSTAIRFHLNSNDQAKASSFAVSYDHIVYVGTSFENRRPVLSQDVKPGDFLITNKGSVAVVKIESVFLDLVNVLTVDPHLEIQTGDGSEGSSSSNVVISAHSYDEAMYGVLFAPVKYAYWAFGPTAVEYMKPLFDFIDASMEMPSFRGVANKMSILDA